MCVGDEPRGKGIYLDLILHNVHSAFVRCIRLRETPSLASGGGGGGEKW